MGKVQSVIREHFYARYSALERTVRARKGILLRIRFVLPMLDGLG